MRKALYDILDGEGQSRAANIYAVAMVLIIAVSLVPLCFHEIYPVFAIVERVCAAIFILDYLARWATADYKLKKGALSFLLYPFTPMAIIDLVSILPFFIELNPALRTLRCTRLLLTLRAFRLLRYSTGLSIIIGGIARQLVPLFFVGLFVIAYAFISAVIVFNAEPETFETFLEAIYWSVITLATVGYGDYHPVTDIGRIVTTISAFVGIAVIALPSSIITAGVMDELTDKRLEREKAAVANTNVADTTDADDGEGDPSQ